MRAVLSCAALAGVLLVACGDDDYVENTPSRSGEASPTRTVTLTPPVDSQTPTATATPAPSNSETGPTSSGPISGTFREFASQFEDALSRGDLSQLIEIAERTTVICVGDEQLGPCAGKPAGEVITGIPGSAWRSDASAIFSDADYAANLARYVARAQASMSDQFGSGAPQLYAIARKDGDGEAGYQLITTAIVDQHPSTAYPIEPPTRVALVFNFTERPEGVRFTGERYAAAAVSADDWLSGQCTHCYDYWESWEG
jgi:hypothetical protein